MKSFISIISGSILFALLINIPVQASDESKEQTHGSEQLSGSDKQEQVNISGLWIGYYEYDKPKGRPEGMFHLIVSDLGDKFGMTFLEPRNHPREYVQAAINTTAKRQGKYIEFNKVYTHNQRTKIQYNLTISHNGSVMSGTWKIDDNTYGRAFFYRLHLNDLKNIKNETIN
ncbi:hypothetical protein [Kangiella sediminilitoris]|uniref:Uncharacterized protein n=1 Tax=Kangiella sediminilitoris TaxID=1144748 RepID=A0A1B3BC40_9GAMM|nr:hypothetical protein [Kangiella sediminilitoris]AOE50325.1 hypothetical protein KS2013_1615 [Kangiella sediminilitoris]